MDLEPSTTLARPKSGGRTSLWIGLAVSAAVHGVMLWTPIPRAPLTGVPASGISPVTEGAPTGIRLYSLAGLDEPPGEDRLPQPTVMLPAPVSDDDESLPTEVTPTITRTPPAAIPERSKPILGPSLSDPRLWKRRTIPTADSLDERRALVDISLGELNRAQATADRETRGMSAWSWHDAAGGRWGLAAGRLHLGAITLPYCQGGGLNAADCGFGILPGRRAEYDRNLAMEQQARRFDLERSWRDRVQAIRARRDAERRDTPPSGAGRQIFRPG